MIEGLTIRQPNPSEYETVTSVWMSSWESIGLAHPHDVSFDQLYKKLTVELASDWDLYVADLDGNIVGMLALKPSENQLDQLFIHPKFKGRGIGHHLINFAKGKMPHGMWLRTAEMNDRAIALYIAEGFYFERMEARPEWDRNDAYYRWQPAP